MGGIPLSRETFSPAAAGLVIAKASWQLRLCFDNGVGSLRPSGLGRGNLVHDKGPGARLCDRARMLRVLTLPAAVTRELSDGVPGSENHPEGLPVLLSVARLGRWLGSGRVLPCCATFLVPRWQTSR